MSSSQTPAAEQHPAEALLGHVVSCTQQKAGWAAPVERSGTVVDWKLGYSTIVDTANNVQWPSFRMKIKPEDGSRAFWTPDLPDTTKPRPWR